MHLEFHWLANRMITAWVFSCFGDSLLTLLLICHCIGWVQTESAVRRVARVLSHQKDHYSRSRSFGVTLADECEDAPFTACLIKTLPTQDPGTHYSAFWSFGITMVGKTQISLLAVTLFANQAQMMPLKPCFKNTAWNFNKIAFSPDFGTKLYVLLW